MNLSNLAHRCSPVTMLLQNNSSFLIIEMVFYFIAYWSFQYDTFLFTSFLFRLIRTISSFLLKCAINANAMLAETTQN